VVNTQAGRALSPKQVIGFDGWQAVRFQNTLLNMNKAFALALLVGGLILVFFGLNESSSFNSDVSRFFTGNPTDKAVWMLIAGGVAAAAGLTMTLRGAKH
jgi:hypothetical protein